MNKKILLGSFLLLALYSCKNDIRPDDADRGEADFSSYIAIGNSLTAGFADGTLYRSGQENSYPSMLAGQFAFAGGGNFRQPLLASNNGYPNMRTILAYREDCATGVIGIAPTPLDGTVHPDDATNISDRGPYNNLGIPGIRTIDITVPFYPTANPYSKRMLSPADASGTMMSAILKSTPTFFTCWLGNNDVLGYASNGGTGNVPGVALGDISPLPAFKAAYDQLIDSLVAKGAKGVLITIPDVTSTPAFSTIPYNGLVLTREGQVDSLNTAYAPLGITFFLGNNPFIIEDAAAPGGRRQAVSGELIILSASDSIKCGGWGSAKPIPDAYALDKAEVENIVMATDQFNFVIKDAAARHQLAVFDAHTYLKTLASGIVWNGVTYSPAFVSGGLFSLDAVHLTPRGYALVANQIIKTINSHYKSSIPEVDINDYPGIIFP